MVGEHGCNTCLAIPKYHDRLQKVNMVNAISVTAKLDINCDNNMCIQKDILFQWSTTSHMFMVSWGEITFILKDMAILLNLPCFGVKDLSNFSLSKDEMNILKLLDAALEDSHRKGSSK